MPCAGRSPTARAIRMKRPRTEGKTAPPDPQSLPVAKTSPQPSTLRLYTEPAARAAISAGHRGQPARSVAGIPASNRLDASIRGRTGAQDLQREIDGRIDLVRSGQPGARNLSGASRPERAVEGERIRRQVSFRGGCGLASAIGGMLEEILQLRRALVEREAELAAGVPLVPHPEEPEHLADRLEAVLRGGAQAVGCHAAALYLLDEATSKLKLRSCWGLPLDRLTAPPRPLEGAVADLESMLGHAIVLEDTAMMRHWRAPEDFAAAACVPVSTSTTILGTLWMFSNAKRDFTAQQTNIVEVVAGRLAADLDREMLWQEGFAAAAIKKQIAAAERMQRNQLPTVAPLLDHWDMAGWTAQADSLGGDFHDWFCLPDGLLAVAVGHAMEGGIPAALAASGLKAALRAHGQYYREAQQTLKRLNLTLWTGSAGDQHATLFYGLIETATGRICTASAGHPAPGDSRRRLGVADPDFRPPGRGTGIDLRADRLRVAAGRNAGPVHRRRPGNARGRRQTARRGRHGQAAASRSRRPAAEMAAILRRQLEQFCHPRSRQAR